MIFITHDLQEEYNLTYLFISHDLSIIRHISNRVAVMYLGELAELGETEALFEDPKRPYTPELLSAVPNVGVCGIKGRIILKPMFQALGTHPKVGDSILAVRSTLEMSARRTTRITSCQRGPSGRMPPLH